jgi:hypothetical protein
MADSSVGRAFVEAGRKSAQCERMLGSNPGSATQSEGAVKGYFFDKENQTFHDNFSDATILTGRCNYRILQWVLKERLW